MNRNGYQSEISRQFFSLARGSRLPHLLPADAKVDLVVVSTKVEQEHQICRNRFIIYAAVLILHIIDNDNLVWVLTAFFNKKNFNILCLTLSITTKIIRRPM